MQATSEGNWQLDSRLPNSVALVKRQEKHEREIIREEANDFS